jgi:glucose-6-phosphate isomerase
MPNNTVAVNKSPAWRACKAHYEQLKNQRISHLFTPDRVTQFSCESSGIYLDYSKNLLTPTTLNLLFDLAQAQDLSGKQQALASGALINHSEQRPALHMALRKSGANLQYNQLNLQQLIQTELEKMYQFSADIHGNIRRGHQNKPFTDVINIGIGGSHLGPKMACHALTDYAQSDLRMHFLANIDAAEIKSLLASLDPDSSLFICSSKSFTTLETLQNAKTIKNWLGPKRRKQVVAVTAHPDKAIRFGIAEDNIFKIWDFVGGRYSIWSATGLPIVLQIGKKNFQQFLAGAHAMDQHFLDTPMRDNMPIILGLLSIWHINFCNTSTQAILPYSHFLRDLPAHLQQLDMESCGKSVTQSGLTVDYQTGSIIWGEAGTIGQHSFHQLLHQGTYDMPIDFILPVAPSDFSQHQDILIASCLSQSQSLMLGCPEHADAHKRIPGNKPSNTLILDGLSPATLGALIALYEHKVFVQAMIWDINPFDQFGVELGKKLTQNTLNALHHPATAHADPSTQACLSKIRQLLNKARQPEPEEC